MTLLPLAPSPVESPIPEGTRVTLDDQATFLDRDLLSGGSPWRLLRLSGSSREVARRWQGGGVVRSGEERFARTLVTQGLLNPHFSSELDLDEIDVVVPVFNDVAPLRVLLARLSGFHVTIVDDGSTYSSDLQSCAEEAGAAIVHLASNSGPARARNAAARATSREFLWFIDADVDVNDARDSAQRLRSTFVDPNVAAVAPRVRGKDGPSRRERFEHHFGPLDMGERSGLVVPGAHVGYVPSACLMVRRSAFGEGFDESLRVGEDVDFVWRLHDQGWLVRYQASVVASHPARRSWTQWWHQRQSYGASSGELARRHGARLAPMRADPWTFVAWISLLVGRPGVGARVLRAARVHAREHYFQSEDEPDRVAHEVVTRNMLRAGGPLARATVRTFGALLLMTALHPRLRTRALGLFALGTLWRWRHQRFHVSELPLGVADDLAYGTGVVRGAWRAKTLRPLTPDVTRSSLRLGELLGLRTSRERKIVSQ